MKIDENIDPIIHQSFIQIIHNNWDAFCAQEASRPIFDFDFFLDTSDLNSVCCRQPVYDIREQKNINTHIQIQEDNDWIYDYEGPWVHYYY